MNIQCCIVLPVAEAGAVEIAEIDLFWLMLLLSLIVLAEKQERYHFYYISLTENQNILREIV